MDQPRLSYENKVILAPMVRVGTLPMRLLALDYGADIVYTEELIDWKLLRSVRRENDILKTIDYMDNTDGTIIFRTCARERNQLVLQMGTCDPERALKVGKLVYSNLLTHAIRQNDVAGIDINMGCPKEFSLKGGMGAALLYNPEKAKAILQTLVDGLKIPVTCKIRVFEDEMQTIKLVKELVATGISAIGVHGRTKFERHQHANRNQLIARIAQNVNIPVIANGGSKEVTCYEDIAKFRKNTGASSVMIARVAQGNCSIFSSKGLKPLDDVITAYLKYSVDYDNAPSNTKYCVQNILKELQETPRGKQFLETQTLEQICAIWNLDSYCREKQLQYQANGILNRRTITPDLFAPKAKKLKIDAYEDVTTMPCAFVRASYNHDPELPKSMLNVYCHKNKWKLTYETVQEDKLFRSVVEVNGSRYSSTFWEKNKRNAEQGAAIVALLTLGVISRETLIKQGSILS